MEYRYYLVWYKNVSDVRRPFLRVLGSQIEMFRENGEWELDDTYASMFWGDVIVDEITEQEAKELMAKRAK